MKKRSRIIAAAAALMIAVCSVPLSASAAPKIRTDNLLSVSAESVSYVTFQTIEDAGEYVREQLKLRTPELHIRISRSAGVKDILNDVLGAAFAETGNGNEGDYLRLTIEGYSSGTGFVGKDPILDIRFYYLSTLEQEEAVTKKIAELEASFALEGSSEYEKISAVYDYLIKNVVYPSDDEDDVYYTAYGALVNGSSVCQGFIQSLYRMLTDLGVTCRAVVGNDGTHVWAIAGIDGVFYNLDPTWDSNFRGVDKLFFLRGSEDFDEFAAPMQHVISTGNEENIAFAPDYTSEAFRTAYPVSPTAYPIVKSFIKGDLDNDGCITVMDYISMRTLILTMKGTINAVRAADLNDDHKVNISDAVMLKKFLHGKINAFNSVQDGKK